MRQPKKVDRAGLHAGLTAWAGGVVRGRGRAVSGGAASWCVMAAARTTGAPAARICAWRHDQDPDPVSSRHGPGQAAAGRPLHQRGVAPVAAGAAERDPGRAAACGSIAGSGRSEEHTSELQSRQYLVCRLLLEKKITHLYRLCTALLTAFLSRGICLPRS